MENKEKSLLEQIHDQDRQERPEAYNGQRYGISPLFSAMQAAKTIIDNQANKLLPQVAISPREYALGIAKPFQIEINEETKEIIGLKLI